MGVKIHSVTRYRVEYGTAFSSDLTEDIINFFCENGWVNEERTEGTMDRSIFIENLKEMEDGELKTALSDMEKNTRTADKKDQIHNNVRFALF